MRIKVPAGYLGRINVSYEGFTLFKISELITIMSLVGVIIYAANGYLSKRKRGMKE